MSVHDLGVNDMLAVLKLTDNPVDENNRYGCKTRCCILWELNSHQLSLKKLNQ